MAGNNSMNRNQRVLAHNGVIAPGTVTSVTVTASTQVLSATADVIAMTVGNGVAGVASLAAGVEGARVVLVAASVGSGGATIAVTLTGNPSAFDLLTFDATHDLVALEYINGAWRVMTNIGSVTVG